MQYEDTALVTDLQQGMFMTGTLRPCFLGVSDDPAPIAPSNIHELRQERLATNLDIVGSLTESEWAEDIWQETNKDAAEGYMTEPVPLSTIDLNEVTITRRLQGLDICASQTSVVAAARTGVVLPRQAGQSTAS